MGFEETRVSSGGEVRVGVSAGWVVVLKSGT